MWCEEGALSCQWGLSLGGSIGDCGIPWGLWGVNRGLWTVMRDCGVSWGL